MEIFLVNGFHRMSFSLICVHVYLFLCAHACGYMYVCVCLQARGVGVSCLLWHYSLPDISLQRIHGLRKTERPGHLKGTYVQIFHPNSKNVDMGIWVVESSL